MARVLSGIQPTGHLHVGNYLGALRQWVVEQYEADCFYCVVDLHSMTVEHDPEELRRCSIENAIGLMAAGLDPDVCTIFLQSHVHEHSELSWILECTATVGELSRMTQYKEKSRGKESVRSALLTYPVLMTADILLYDAERVPVGDDQRQHLELARDIAIRFNGRYGDTFVVPQAVIPKFGARVMDLQQPERKMSKSAESPLGTLHMFDPPDEIARKVKKAVTDTEGRVRYDRQDAPGVSNLVEMLAAATGRTIEDVVESYSQYGPLKADLIESLVTTLAPVRARFEEMLQDTAGVASLLEKGAAKAADVASVVLRRAKDAVGLVPPGA
ncbi:MAG TPA: tryptophan--tRNA ligase [Acidimicrobiales bacterium]|nr:tryptophan--tRNA ligase [Acidimicrobiales bacterium]